MVAMKLSEFLLARIDEREASAKEAGDNNSFEYGDDRWCESWLSQGIRHLVRNCDIECFVHEDDGEACGRPHRYAGSFIALWDPAFVLSWCDSMRRVIELTRLDFTLFNEIPSLELRILALPFADHPDYQQEWRP
jgi:hypothetical protein